MSKSKPTMSTTKVFWKQEDEPLDILNLNEKKDS